MRTRAYSLSILLSFQGLLWAGTPLEPGFSETTFAGGLDQPTSLAWAPDNLNRLFVTLKEGGVRVIENGVVNPTPFATFPQVHTRNESGVIGICFDPQYSRNHFVYVFVTVSDAEQRIVRFTDMKGVGTAAKDIISGLPTRGENHNGGGIGFGPDGKLYWAVGDNGARRGINDDLTLLAAKVGRANADGTIPRDNPFYDGAGPNNDYVWATGLRNPFKMKFQPRTGKLWVNIVGDGHEQIYALNAGDDVGYDRYEGNQPAGSRFSTPFPRPLAHPVIQYKTGNGEDPGQLRDITSAERKSGLITITTSKENSYGVGQALLLNASGQPEETVVVAAVISKSTLKAFSRGVDTTLNTGTLKPLVQGSALTGGCFYDAKAFPADYQGNFFYGDFTGGRIMRAVLNKDNQCTAIRYFVTDAHSITDMATGPDGALYYTAMNKKAIQRVAYTTPAVVSTHVAR